MVARKARANPKRYISGLNKKHETRLELVADDKHTSFLPSEHLSCRALTTNIKNSYIGNLKKLYENVTKPRRINIVYLN